MGATLWEKLYGCNPVGGILWVQSCGRISKGAIMWVQFYGYNPLGGIIWVQPCGRNSMGAILWAQLNGRNLMGRILWEQSCGRNYMWEEFSGEEFCVGGILCGCNTMGAVIHGRNNMWEEKCVGAILWAQSYGRNTIGRNPNGTEINR